MQKQIAVLYHVGPITDDAVALHAECRGTRKRSNMSVNERGSSTADK